LVRSGKNARVFPPLRIRQESRYLFLDFIFILFSFFLRAFFIIISYFLVIWLCELAGCFFLLLLLSLTRGRGIYTTQRGGRRRHSSSAFGTLFFFIQKACSSLQTYLTFLLMSSCPFFFWYLIAVGWRSSGSDLAMVDALDVRIYASVPILVIPEWNDG
jgi:hypothetical protein